MPKLVAMWVTQDGDFRCSAVSWPRHDQVLRAALALLAAAMTIQADAGESSQAPAALALYYARCLAEGISPVMPRRPDGAERLMDWERQLSPRNGVVCGAVFGFEVGEPYTFLLGPDPVAERLTDAIHGGPVAFAEFVGTALRTAKLMRERPNG